MNTFQPALLSFLVAATSVAAFTVPSNPTFSRTGIVVNGLLDDKSESLEARLDRQVSVYFSRGYYVKHLITMNPLCRIPINSIVSLVLVIIIDVVSQHFFCNMINRKYSLITLPLLLQQNLRNASVH